MPWQLTDWRALTLTSCLLLTALALVVPAVQLPRMVYAVTAFVDITGSMKVRDMGDAARPIERLEAAKSALRMLVAELPCRSRFGLGIFTERRGFVLFDPIEVCANFAPVEQSIANIDWRMGWEGDSLVAKGLNHAIAATAPLDADILFLTDGQEAPPLPPGSSLPAFEGEPGKVKGAIVGVGGHAKVPIPKFDSEGQESGSYGEQDVVQENRSGGPPPDAESRPGYHPKWAPFGSDPPTGDEHLSSVRSEHLTALAAQTGLAYAGLLEQPDLLPVVMRSARPRIEIVAVDIRPLPAALALVLLVGLYAGPLAARGLSFITLKTSGSPA
jgi:mxaL protein